MNTVDDLSRSLFTATRLMWSGSALLFVSVLLVGHTVRAYEIPMPCLLGIMYTIAIVSGLLGTLDSAYVLLTKSDNGERALHVVRVVMYMTLAAIIGSMTTVINEHFADCHRCLYASRIVRRENEAADGLIAYSRVTHVVLVAAITSGAYAYIMFMFARYHAKHKAFTYAPVVD